MRKRYIKLILFFCFNVLANYGNIMDIESLDFSEGIKTFL